MNIKKFITDDRAVSPVIGVILMVAITVILAAVIGTFVLGLGDQVSSTTPSASFNFDYTEDASGANDTLEVTHGGGDTLTAGQVSVILNGASASNGTDINNQYNWTDFGSSGDINAGSTANVERSNIDGSAGVTLDSGEAVNLGGATVRVQWSAQSGDNSAVIGKWTGPNA